MKGRRVLAAMDMEKTENNVLMRKYNVSGFPTMIWFDNAVAKQTVEDDGLAEFLEDPDKPREKKEPPKEEQWADDENSEIVHLTNENFAAVLKDEKSAIVLFYANWCGHCELLYLKIFLKILASFNSQASESNQSTKLQPFR